MLVQLAKEFLSKHSQTNAFGWMSFSARKHCAATYGATGVCVSMIAYIVYIYINRSIPLVCMTRGFLAPELL